MSLPVPPPPAPELLQLLPTLLDLSLAGVVCYTPVLDAAGQVVDFAFAYVNPAAQRLLGVPARPAVSYLQQFSEARANGAFAFHCATFMDGGPAHFELDYQAEGYDSYFRVAGQRVGGELLISFTVSEMPECSAVAVALRTRQTQAQAARLVAEQQRARLARLIAEAPAGICVLSGPALVFELVNPTYQALFPSHQLLGQPVLEAMPELVGQRVPALLRGVYETGITYEGREVLMQFARPGDGQLEDRYFDFIYQARYDEAGAIDGLVVFAFEVTEQVRVRRAVEASAQRLQLLTDALPVLIAYLDHTPTYRFVNQAYQAWFHRSPAEIVGRSPLELIGEAAYARVRGHLTRALAGERVEYEATMAYRPDFTRHTHGTFIPDIRNGEVVGCYSLVHDVTELVAARRGAEASAQQALALADALRQANEQLTRTNVDLDNFIYTASHDLRTPIANIEGLLLAIQQELPAAGRVGQVPAMLGLMQGAVERFGRTIGHLTDISRLQQEHERPVTAVDLAAVVREVQLDLAPLLRETGGQLLVDVPAETTLLFAEKNLRSVVYNLLSNALKYHHPDRPPQVRVTYQPQAPYQVLTVRDNGLGFDLMRGEEKLFGMFQRLHTHVEGSGVGLYMVKRMVENAGGRIEVQSQLGQGSTFRVYFLSPASQ
ncbi:MAG: sensor histidine kinase [Janthinobacterium lividum]